jgi:uroporphyrinogen decarboxylase
MIAGGSTSDQVPARLFALKEPAAFAHLMDVLVEASAAFLTAQAEAGADVVQLFESWAANLDERAFMEWVIEPNRRIVEKVRGAVPHAGIIGFPRGAGAMLGAYAERTAVDMVGLDQMQPPLYAERVVPSGMGVQGNLDPLQLVVGGAQMEDRVRGIISAFAGRPHVFNLGHGIVPETPIEHVSRLIEIVKGG